MAITVTMIEEKEFKTKMRGYDPVEVDEFLDEICDEMVAMQEEIVSLQGRLAKSGTRVFAPNGAVPAPAAAPTAVPPPAFAPTAAPAPLAFTPEVKDSVAEDAARLLRSAQKVYDETVEDAKREADKILADAKGSVHTENLSLAAERDALNDEIKSLRASAKAYREKLLALLDEQKTLLDAAPELFDEETK